MRGNNIITSFTFELILFLIFIVLPASIILPNIKRMLGAFNLIKRKVSEGRCALLDLISTILIPLIFFCRIYGMRKYTEPIRFGEDTVGLHIPFAHEHFAVIVVLLAFSVLSFWMLKLTVNGLPPILHVIFTSGLVIGIILNIALFIQVANNLKNLFSIYFSIFISLNLILEYLIGLKTGLDEFIKREELKNREYRNILIGKLYSLLMKSSTLYPIVFFTAVPVFILIQCILILFGQQPDAAIKAFVETSDWTFSKFQSPQPLYIDNHYLCTVTLRGHKKFVKPLRYGFRHDHVILVNRQLLVANAFENILEEYTPRAHKAIRKFYDTYGFPIAKCITSPLAADITYVIMKPLEWVFILCLYIVDKNPENRIAVQYLPKGKNHETAYK